MYFTRNNYADGKEGYNKNKTILLNFTGLKRMVINGRCYRAKFNSDNYSVAHPSLSPDGKKLYFSSDMPVIWTVRYLVCRCIHRWVFW